MAAWLGSRYGGLKQIDPIGPNGEILLEFAIQDMISFGGEKVICIISESIRQDFETTIVKKYQWKIAIELVVQTIENTPSIPHTSQRTKPWWTAHAIWCVKDALDGPFIVINADDFYGREALHQAYSFLLKNERDNHCVITYPLQNTLSPYWTVSRGICEVHEDKLFKIVEHTKIAYHGEVLVHTCQDGSEVILDTQSPTNMNLFGFQRSFLDILNQECTKFFQEFWFDEKREFFLPSVVMEMITEKKGEIYALSTMGEWFWMTYPEDRLEAKEKIKKILPS